MFDDIFGNESVADAIRRLQKATYDATLKEVVNKHSKAIKQLVTKIEKLEARIKALEGDKG